MSEQPGPVTDPAEPPEAGVLPVDLRDYVDFSPDAAVRVRVLATPHLALDLWCIEPQQATPVLHLEDRDVVYTVVGGRSWFVTDDGEVGLDPMGTMLVPAGTVHGIDNRGADPLIVAAATSPPGDDPADDPVTRDEAAVRRDAGAPSPLRRAWRTLMDGPRRGA